MGRRSLIDLVFFRYILYHNSANVMLVVLGCRTVVRYKSGSKKKDVDGSFSQKSFT